MRVTPQESLSQATYNEFMQRIYLDANATTPVLPKVIEAMYPFWSDSFGNPSSAHQSGQRTRSAVEHARASVAALLTCTPKEIVFTSGGTEGNNLALSGILQPFLDRKEQAHLITSRIEHHAVLYAAEALERRGVEVTYVAPTRDGVIDPATVEAALKPHTKLVSIMLANNETGAIQPIGDIARIAEQHHVLLHTDAVQGAGKVLLDLSGELTNVNLLTISGHKMYAPQGTGVLFVRKGVTLAPLFYGGPHERQRRAGTENVPGIVALGKAADLANTWLCTVNTANLVTSAVSTEVHPHESVVSTEHASSLHPEQAPDARSRRISVFAEASAKRERVNFESASSNPRTLQVLRDRLEQGLLATIPNAYINACQVPRVPNTTNIRFSGVDAEALLIALDLHGIAASFGAACMSGATEPSHVLLAMGLTPMEARSSLRLSLTRFTTPAEIDRVLEIIPTAVARLRSLA